MDRMVDTLDNTVAALLGVASRKVRDFVADVTPNFREEYRELGLRFPRRTESKGRGHSISDAAPVTETSTDNSESASRQAFQRDRSD